MNFQIFQCEINNLANGHISPLWHGIIRQACLKESSIFSCVIAIAALDRARKSRASNSSSHFEFHHHHALQRYGGSLEGRQKVIARGDSCIRTARIDPLLVFCFRIFDGDIRFAINGARTAIDLMYVWISHQRSVPVRIGFSPALNVVENEVVEVVAGLDWHLRNASKILQHMSS